MVSGHDRVKANDVLQSLLWQKLDGRIESKKSMCACAHDISNSGICICSDRQSSRNKSFLNTNPGDVKNISERVVDFGALSLHFYSSLFVLIIKIYYHQLSLTFPICHLQSKVCVCFIVTNPDLSPHHWYPDTLPPPNYQDCSTCTGLHWYEFVQ